MQHLLCRSGRYYYNRRVPDQFRPYDPRKQIRVSLKTDSKRQATRLAALHNAKLEEYWENLVYTGQKHSHAHYQAVVERAKMLGFPYLPVNELVPSPIEELLKRFQTVNEKFNEPHVEAILGGIPKPEIRLDDALAKFWDLAKDKTLNKSLNQLRKWKNPRKLAMNNFIACVGNKVITELTREDTLKFRDWWIDRIHAENLGVDGANKNFFRVKTIIETVSENFQLNIDIKHLFKKLKLDDDEYKQRSSFSTEYINNVLLDPGNLSGLNEEAKWVLYAFAETGAGLSELVGLQPDDIRLDAEIPHIAVTSRKGNPLKTKYRRRVIPLVGYALDAFKAFPAGFTKYMDNPDGLSATLSKFLNENNLFPSEKHTVNSLRHSFQDRLTAIDVPDRIQAELMGHKFHRPLYGDGPTLAHKHEWVKKIQLQGLNPGFN